MIDCHVEMNMGFDICIMEVNLHPIHELRGGIERTLMHNRPIGFGLADILVCHDSELSVVEVN
jgi:hypothetical protein